MCWTAAIYVHAPHMNAVGRRGRLTLRAASPLSRNREVHLVLPNAYTKLTFSSSMRRCGTGSQAAMVRRLWWLCWDRRRRGVEGFGEGWRAAERASADEGPMQAPAGHVGGCEDARATRRGRPFFICSSHGTPGATNMFRSP